MGGSCLFAMWHSSSVVDQLAEQHFFDPVVNAVHAAYPFHLVSRFQLLGDTFGNFHLRDQPTQAFLAGIVNAVQVLHELAGQQELIEQEGTMLPEVVHAHSAVLTKRAHVIGRNANVGQVVVSTAAIGQFHGVSSLSAAIEKAAMYLKVSLQAITA